MRVLVTGADGFIGRALVHALRVGHDVIATDRDDGDIADPAHLDRLFAAGPFDRVFHLAAIVSGAAEADFDAGRRVNLDATIGLLDRCRAQARRGGPVVRFVHASSIAVFGTPLPARIDDATEPKPSLSYGTHKRVAELLIDDATRRGELDGRALRLSGVVVRPALPNGALSAFNSDVIREPLAGRDYECPVGADATIWVTSRRAAVANLLHLAEARRRGDRRAARAHGAGARRLDRRHRRRARPLRRRRAGARSLRAAAGDRSAVRPLAARLLVRARRGARPGRRSVDRRADPRSSGNDAHDPRPRRSSAPPSSRKASTARRTAPSCARPAWPTRTWPSRSSASSASTARTRRARCRSGRRPTPRASASPRRKASPCRSRRSRSPTASR